MLDPQSAEAAFAEALTKTSRAPGDLIPLLQAAQVAFGYVPIEAMERIGATLSLPLAEVYGVVTFYRQFRLTPRGRNLIRVCDGTACHVNDAMGLIEVIEEVLGLKPGQTDANLDFTLETVACLGCCSLAPVVVVNDETHGRLEPRKLRTLLGRLKKQVAAGQAAPAKA